LTKRNYHRLKKTYSLSLQFEMFDRSNNLILQLGHPKIHLGSSHFFEQPSVIFVHTFRPEEESVYLFWHQIPIRLRYHQDLSHNFDAILAMVWLIQRDPEGATKVDLTTQLLTVHWELHWQKDNLTIQSTFTAHEDLYVPYAQALNQQPTLQIAKSAFLSEWKTLLHQIIVAFKAGKVEIEDGTERRKWELLQRVEQQIPQYGKLYIRPPL
jgi:hypothetical protein